jgi:hypothetical protein
MGSEIQDSRFKIQEPRVQNAAGALATQFGGGGAKLAWPERHGGKLGAELRSQKPEARSQKPEARGQRPEGGGRRAEGGGRRAELD